MDLPAQLPAELATTRAGLHRLACYVLAPARLASEGRIGLRPAGDGFGTAPLADGSRIEISGAELIVRGADTERRRPISTLRDAAGLVGIPLDPRPAVGADLPAFAPDDELLVEAVASRVVGAWYSLGAEALRRVALRPGVATSASQLWPEHMDLAVVVTPDSGTQVNVGVSPGDAGIAEPYVYVGPFDRTGLVGSFWNAPFGAARTYAELVTGGDVADAMSSFMDEGIARAAGSSATSR